MEASKMKSVLIAPKSYLWNTPENTVVGSHLGNNSSTIRELPPQTGQTSLTGSVQWNTRFPDGLVESTPLLRSELNFTIGNVAGATAVDRVNACMNKIGVASFPLNRAITSATVELNGYSSTTYVRDMVDPFVHSANPEVLGLISQASETDDYALFDSTRLNDPLQSGGNAIDSTKSRGFGCNYESTITSDAGGAGALVRVKVVLEEMLMATPFQFQDPGSAQPFKNINSFIVNLNFTNLADALNVAGINKNNAANPLDINLTSARHSMLIRTWNPSLKEKIPDSLVYNAPKVERKLRQSGTVGAGMTGVKIPINAITLNGIPSMFAVHVKRPDAPYIPIRNFPITGLHFDMDNKTGLLENLDQYQLYLLSSKNGYNKRYATFGSQDANPFSPGTNPGCGSWVFIRPSDLGLNEGTLANVNKTLNITGEITVDSVRDADEAYVAEIYTITDNFVVDKDSTFSDVRPLLSPEQLLSSPVQYTGEDKSSNRVLGGAWWNNVWNRVKSIAQNPFVKRTSRYVRNNAPVISEYLADGTPAGDFANAYGYGMPHTKTKAKKGKKTKGGDMVRVGGKKLTAGELSQLLG